MRINIIPIRELVIPIIPIREFIIPIIPIRFHKRIKRILG